MFASLEAGRPVRRSARMRSMSTDHDAADPPAHEDHGHTEEPLGSIDVAAWGAGLLGLVIGVAIAACFFLATSPPV